MPLWHPKHPQLEGIYHHYCNGGADAVGMDYLFIYEMFTSHGYPLFDITSAPGGKVSADFRS
jgi:hypothetical protein